MKRNQSEWKVFPTPRERIIRIEKFLGTGYYNREYWSVELPVFPFVLHGFRTEEDAEEVGRKLCL